MTQATALATHPHTRIPVPKVAPPTRTTLLLACAAAFEQRDVVSFGTLYQVEYMSNRQLRKEPVAGTPFEIVDEEVLAPHGLPTDGTMRSAMRALKLKKREVHDLVCMCMGAQITGEEAARRFRDLAAKDAAAA